MFTHSRVIISQHVMSNVKRTGMYFCIFGTISTSTGFGLQTLYKNYKDPSSTLPILTLNNMQPWILTNITGIVSGLIMTGIYSHNIVYNPNIIDKGLGRYYNIKIFSRNTKIIFGIFNAYIGTLIAKR